MNTSPDSFYSIRYHAANVKAQNTSLQQMEHRAHSFAIEEYNHDIINHLIHLQYKSSPTLSLIQQQPEINLKMRPLLLDFLMDVINKLNLSKSTFPLCVNLIDRYCSTRIVKKQHYQLLGLTSLWISCKNSDNKTKIPSLNDLCKMCCNCYDKKLFLEMENHLLKSLNWMISFPTFDAFIDIFYEKYSNIDIFVGSNFTLKQVKYLSLYICELIQFYPNIYFNYKSVEISISAFILSLLILNVNIKYSFEIQRLNSMFKLEFITVKKFQNLFNQLIKILKCPPPSLKLKYFHKSNKNLNLMQLLIKFCNISAVPILSNPITPKNSIHKTNQLPPTPISNNISPMENHHLKEFLPSPKLSPHTNFFNGSPPVTPFEFTAPTNAGNANLNTNSENNNTNLGNDIMTSCSSTNNYPSYENHSLSNNNANLYNISIAVGSSLNASSTSVVSSNTNMHSTESLITSSSVPSMKKRSYQLLNSEHEKDVDSYLNKNENLKRSKSQKPIFYIN